MKDHPPVPLAATLLHHFLSKGSITLPRTPGYAGPINQETPVTVVPPTPPPVLRGVVTQKPTATAPYHTLPVGAPGPFLEEKSTVPGIDDIISKGLDVYEKVQVARAAAQASFAPAYAAAPSAAGASGNLPAPLPVATPTPSGANYPGMSMKNICYEAVTDAAGNVIAWRLKKKRHRRKRMLTKSDMEDIAALKGIVGQGKAFNELFALLQRR